MTYEQLAKVAEEAGFSAWADLDVSTIELKPEVRDMCAVNSCGQYGKRWSCPPGCGTLEECTQRVQACTHGILVQTVGKTEKTVDTKAYRRTEQQHLEQFHRLCEQVRQIHPQALCLGSGGCRICGVCAWPEPCRFPEKACSSMEAYGMVVLEVCKANGLQYYYGADKMAYTSCFLLKD